MMYMWNDFFAAMALVLVFEGVLPFLKPAIWRKTMGRMIGQPDNSLRLMGLTSMLMGVALLYIIRQS